MSEIHSNLYLKHPEVALHIKCKKLLAIADLNSNQRIANIEERKNRFIEVSKSINPQKGEELATAFFRLCEEENDSDFGSESIREDSGYCVSHWVKGSGGFKIQIALMYFFSGLDSEIHIQSWSCGGDDPCETWLKLENSVVIEACDEPYSENDVKIYGTVYYWWHKDMPSTIREGYLNEDGYQEICEENFGKVFLNKSSLNQISEQKYRQWQEEAITEKPRRSSHNEPEAENYNTVSIESDLSTEELLTRLDEARNILKYPLLKYWYRFKYTLMGKKL